MHPRRTRRIRRTRSLRFCCFFPPCLNFIANFVPEKGVSNIMCIHTPADLENLDVKRVLYRCLLIDRYLVIPEKQHRLQFFFFFLEGGQFFSISISDFCEIQHVVIFACPLLVTWQISIELYVPVNIEVYQTFWSTSVAVHKQHPPSLKKEMEKISSVSSKNRLIL